MQVGDGDPGSGAAVAAATEIDDGTVGSPSMSEASATGVQLYGFAAMRPDGLVC